jgi:glutamine synthetase
VLTLEELRADSTIDTVIMAFTDMQGRLLDKRPNREFFLEQIEHGHATEGCD